MRVLKEKDIQRTIARGCLAILFVAWLAPEAAAQFIPELPFRGLTRSKMWTAMTNSGIHGGDRHTSRRAGMPGMSYPGVWGGLQRGAYGDWRTPGPASYAQVYITQPDAGRNMGTYVITKPDPAEYPELQGTFNVSASGVTSTRDIVPMRYPVERMPEGLAGMGFRHEHPKGETLVNWWPGAPPVPTNEITEIHNYDYATYMKPEHKRFGEELGIAHYATETGITVTKKIYQWSFRDYDDFFILEDTFENTGDSDGDGVADLNGGSSLTLKNTYISYVYLIWPTHGGTANRNYGSSPGGLPNGGYKYWIFRVPLSQNYDVIQDDMYHNTEAPNYGQEDPNHSFLAEAIGMKLGYAYDWDSPLSSWDDVGDPHIPEITCCNGRANYNFQIRGEILAGQYAGVMPLDYDPTDGFANDTETYVAPKVADQPFAMPWFVHKEDPDGALHTEDEIARALLTVHLPGERTSMNNLDGRTPLPENPTAPLDVPDNPSRTGGTPNAPMSPNWYTFVYTYGPYDLMPGDKIKIVQAFVGGMPVMENFWEWQKNVPQNQADLHTDKAMRNLIKNARAAKEIYDLEYDVPLPPPDVKLLIKSNPDGNAELAWGGLDELEDPDYAGTPEAKDVAGYRAYRSDFWVQDWKLMQDIPKGDPAHFDAATNTYTFADVNSLAGFDYRYTVTAYDTGHDDYKGRGPVPSMESAISGATQMHRNTLLPFTPKVASSAEANRMEREVTVVPNPYRVDGSHNYQGSLRLRFLNLPNKANIKIFSVSGNLVAEFDHDDPALAEAEYLQFTRYSTGTLSTGLYFYVVESLTPESLGQIKRGKFVLIAE